MKSYNHLMEKYLSDENYYLSLHEATQSKSKHKRKNKKLKYLREHADEYKEYFLKEAESFVNDTHVPKEINDGIEKKKRIIICPTIREQVIHHMIANVLKPIFMKGMYEHSYGSIPGRGILNGKNRKVKSGQKTVEKWVRNGGKDVKYCVKLDIKKFFDSIPHDVLKKKFATIIHDEQFLNVLYELIDVTDRGVPIGFYTSQWIANWYLTGLDHYIKEVLGVKHYIRLMDDMVIFGKSKKKLHCVKREIEKYLSELNLCIKENWQVFLFDYKKKKGDRRGRFLDYMGLRFYRNRTTLRKSIMLKITRKANRVSRKERKTIYDCRQICSYMSWLKKTDSYGIYRDRIKPCVSERYLKHRISSWQKKKNLIAA